MRLQIDLTESNREHRRQLLIELSTTSTQAAQAAYRGTTSTLLRSWRTDESPITDVHEAIIWYLGLRAGSQDPAFRGSLPPDLLPSLDEKLAALQSCVVRLGDAGESMLTPVGEFDLDRFQQHRQGLLQLLDQAL